MTARYVVRAATQHPDPDQAALRGSDAAYWHKQGANGEITCVSQVFTRHEDAVRGVRTDLEITAQILGISRDSFVKVYATDPGLVYYVETFAEGDAQGEPFMLRLPLYPVDDPDPESVES